MGFQLFAEVPQNHSMPAILPCEFLYVADILQGSGAGKISMLSPAYIMNPRPNCFVLFKQAVARALSFALLNAGSNIAARMAMMAITTNNSIKVNADFEVVGFGAVFMVRCKEFKTMSSEVQGLTRRKKTAGLAGLTVVM